MLGDNNNYFIAKFDSDCNLIWIDSIENPFELVGSNKGVESARIKMYPNPTGGRLTIDIDFPESNDLSVKAYNITGQIVFQSHVSGNTSDIDISHLSSGIYFIIVESNRNKWIERVTKL